LIIDYNPSYKIKGNLLLYFYASWSSKCNMYLEALSKLANEFEDFNVVKINTTKYPTLKANYNIKKIPSYILIINDNIVGRLDGYVDSYSLHRWVKRYKE